MAARSVVSVVSMLVRVVGRPRPKRASSSQHSRSQGKGGSGQGGTGVSNMELVPDAGAPSETDASIARQASTHSMTSGTSQRMRSWRGAVQMSAVGRTVDWKP
jgi:hypothetical protein